MSYPWAGTYKSAHGIGPWPRVDTGRNFKEDELKDDILKWFATGQVGESSKAMAKHLLGYDHNGSYPLDPDDFNRCLLFLERVPEARQHLNKLRTISPVWDALVENWSGIEREFLAEVGLDWCKGHRAPKTYAFMQMVIDGARRKAK